MPFAFRPQTANAFARYAFTSGLLKGVAIGGGVNWRGAMVLGYQNGNASQQVRGYQQVYVNGLVSYEYRLGKHPVSFQLNGDNLLGFDDPYVRRLYWFDDAQGPSKLYQYPTQVRRFSLSTTLKL
jgi:outer membrane receptor for ferric coprogen and ferric-rhodotorulic acid